MPDWKFGKDGKKKQLELVRAKQRRAAAPETGTSSTHRRRC
jgi:hypothetical protein